MLNNVASIAAFLANIIRAFIVAVIVISVVNRIQILIIEEKRKDYEFNTTKS